MKTSPGIPTPKDIITATNYIGGIIQGWAETAKDLEQRGVAHVGVEYHGALGRGIDELLRWNAAFQKAVHEIMTDSDAFGRFLSEHEKKATKKKAAQKMAKKARPNASERTSRRTEK